MLAAVRSRSVSTLERSQATPARFSVTSSLPITKFSSRSIGTGQYNKDLKFFLNGKKVVLNQVEPDTTLISYLRSDAGLTGTKLTCGEGGCGACTVTISNYDAKAKKVQHRSINSCLVPLAYVDGMEVTTVEGIGSSKKPHPVQERLALFGGSQCGFCTPGFVMSMYTSLRNNPAPKAAEFTKCMDGNLCRCTGYRPIIDAAKTFCEDTKGTVKAPQNRPFGPYDPATERPFPEELKQHTPRALHLSGERSQWFTPTTLKDMLQIKHDFPDARVISGSTELGIDLRFKLMKVPVFLSPVSVPELNVLNVGEKGLEIGSAVTLSKLYQTLKQHEHQLQPQQKHQSRLLHAIMDQLHWFAGTQIRNVASLGGNIVNASPISDLNPVWMAVGAKFHLHSLSGSRVVDAGDFFIGYKKVDIKPDEILTSITVPWLGANEYIESYKQSKRREDDIAIVTAALLVKIDNGVVSKAKMAYGGMAAVCLLAHKTENFLKGKQWNNQTFEQAVQVLKDEIGLSGDPPGGMAEYRTTLALSFFYKFFLAVQQQQNANAVPTDLRSATTKLFPPKLPVGQQVYDVPKRGTSVGDSEPHLSSRKQTTGEAKYVDDFPTLANELAGALVQSTRAHANIKNIDASDALRVPGVHAFYTAKDVPGSNMWGDIVHDEELFASKTVLHYGQPVGIIVAESEFAAKTAAKLVRVEYEDLPPVLTIDDAIKNNSFFPTVHGVKQGDVEKAFKESDVVITGAINMGGQEQFYFEPNVTIAVPDEGDMIVHTPTQNANKTQKFVSTALGLPANKVVCKVGRLGGGFGGKETRTINISMAAAVAAQLTNRPVRLLLERDVDMGITGGRHPFRGEYKIGLKKDGKINAADLKLYSNGGISHDLSVPVLDRALLFCDSCYNIPNLQNEGRVCKTNMPSNTAFRGFGGPQGQLLTEAWVEHAAIALNMRPEELREKNLYNEGEKTYYGTPVTKSIKRSWEECKRTSNFSSRRQEISEFNANNRHRKRGIALLPSKYGIAFTFNTLNQGSAMVHIYTDGTVLVTHGGVEMGQGLNTKVAQVVATELDIPVSDVHIKEMATDKIPNASPTAASMGSDIYGMAAQIACKQIKERLAPYMKSTPGASLKQIANAAYMDRVSLSAQGFFKSEHQGYNFDKNEGNPWRYFTSGTACTEVELDCLTGDHKVLRTDLVVDVGTPINPTIDIGQIEGAFVQGAGWVSIEELVWGDKQHSWVRPAGRLASCGPGGYKIPSADDIPLDWRVTLLKDTTDPKYETIPVQSSKAVGEPPLLLGISLFSALRDAIQAHRKQEGINGYFHLDSPLTSERLRMACADRLTTLAIGDRQKAIDFLSKGSF